MKIKIPFRIQNVPTARAQAMVEFAIVMPILMLMLFGMFEVGRMIYVYSAVTTASREAVRYGSAVGLDDYGEIKYKHCAAIRERARRAAYFLNLQDSAIEITYDHGPTTTSFHTCTGNVDPGYFITTGDRILIKVTAQYKPYTKLVPWGTRTFVSSSARTVLSYVDLASSPGPGPTSAFTATGTTVPSATATATVPSETPTATVPGQEATATFWPTSTPSLVPTITPTGTVTFIPTEEPTSTITLTPTETGTPTITPTSVTGCGDITAGPISYSGNTMSMTITNPNSYSVTVSDVQVVWNAATGQTENGTLSLLSASLGSTFWTGFSSAGSLTIPVTSVIIPGNNAISTITFTFDYEYANQSGNESIRINLSTFGCEEFPIQRP